MFGEAVQLERGDSHIEPRRFNFKPGRFNFKGCEMIQMNPVKN